MILEDVKNVEMLPSGSLIVDVEILHNGSNFDGVVWITENGNWFDSLTLKTTKKESKMNWKKKNELANKTAKLVEYYLENLK